MATIKTIDIHRGGAQTIRENLEDDCVLFCFSSGQFSLFDLLVELLPPERCPVDVFTWTVSEREALGFLNLKSRIDLRIVCGDSINRTRLRAYKTLLRELGDNIRFVKNHSKGFAIHGLRCISVFSSANFTKNPRIENHVISTVPSPAENISRAVDVIFEQTPPGPPKHLKIEFSKGDSRNDALLRSLERDSDD